MKIRTMRWMGASVLGLALTSAANIAVCQQADELVAAIDAAFPAEQQTTEATAAEVASEGDFETNSSAAKATRGQSTGERSERELSVAPTVKPYYPENIPAWIREPADYSQDRHTIPVGSIPTASEGEADDWLDEQLLAGLYAYIDEHLLEPGAASRMQDRVTAEYIRTNLIDDPFGYIVQLQTSSGPLYQKWVQVVVSPEQRETLRDWHREAIQRERIVPLGLGVAGLLTIVGGFHLLVRRSSSSANKPHVFPVAKRVELPVVKPHRGKKACCGKMGPAFLLAIPIVIAVAAVGRRAKEASREATAESSVVQSQEAEATQVIIRGKNREIVVQAARE